MTPQEIKDNLCRKYNLTLITEGESNIKKRIISCPSDNLAIFYDNLCWFCIADNLPEIHNAIKREMQKISREK